MSSSVVMATSNTSAPAKIPGSRATSSAVAVVVAGTKVWLVTSPKGASSSSAMVTTRSIWCRCRLIGFLS